MITLINHAVGVGVNSVAAELVFVSQNVTWNSGVVAIGRCSNYMFTNGMIGLANSVGPGAMVYGITTLIMLFRSVMAVMNLTLIMSELFVMIAIRKLRENGGKTKL